ncbi:MAG: endonuclease/exonuclease/phosphatase family protein [Planctomycetaceae bacterium]
MAILARARFVALSVLVAVVMSGCDEVLDGLGTQQAEGKKNVTASLPPKAPREGNTVRVATFNIQVFGTSKLAKPNVVDTLTKAIRRFDLVAVQEVRSKDDTILPRFVEKLNADGSRYDFVIGPRLGRTTSTEQYAYVFDTQRIEVDRNSVATVGDPGDRLHREPLVARFRVRGPPSTQAFTFTLINIHTDPDETTGELNALDDVFAAVQRNSAGEDDVILLGDLNVDDRHLGELGRLPNIDWAIAGVPTNTRGNKTYDNIVFDRKKTVEYTGTFGVLSLQNEFGLSLEEALEVSDHLPVWAAFSATEGTAGSLAGGGDSPQ